MVTALATESAHDFMRKKGADTNTIGFITEGLSPNLTHGFIAELATLINNGQLQCLPIPLRGDMYRLR